MLNVIRGLLGGIMGALVGGALFAGAWFGLDWLGVPVPAFMPGLYFGLGAGTGSGILLAMGTRVRFTFAARAAALTLGLGAVGAGVGHLAGRLIYAGLGGGWLESLGTLEEAARVGVQLLTGVGGVTGALSGALLAGAPLVEGSSEEALLEAGAEEENGALPAPKASAGGSFEPTDIPLGEHPADSLSVEELLGELDSED